MQIIAHRGLHTEYPENSFKAIEQAVTNGIKAIEIDVRKCKSGEIVLFHDRNLKRLTGYNRFVIRTPYNELSDLKMGMSNREPIALFRDIVKAFGKDVFFILDIKKETWINDGLERELIEITKKYGSMENTIFSSFNYFVCRRIAKLEPEAKVGVIPAYILQLKLFPVGFAHSIHLDINHLPSIDVMKYKKKGKKIYVWTLNNSNNCCEILRDYPVDGIMSDNPLEIEKCISGNKEEDCP